MSEPIYDYQEYRKRNPLPQPNLNGTRFERIYDEHRLSETFIPDELTATVTAGSTFASGSINSSINDSINEYVRSRINPIFISNGEAPMVEYNQTNRRRSRRR